MKNTYTITIITTALLLLALSGCATKPEPTEEPTTTPIVKKAEPKPKVAEAPAPIIAPEPVIEKLDRPDDKIIVYFAYDSSKLSDKAQDIVEQHANYLKENPNESVVLEGHADERGSKSYNKSLGFKRSLSVRDKLLLMGVSDSQIRTISYGEDKPMVKGSGEDAWRSNRRAVFVYGGDSTHASVGGSAALASEQ